MKLRHFLLPIVCLSLFATLQAVAIEVKPAQISSFLPSSTLEICPELQLDLGNEDLINVTE